MDRVINLSMVIRKSIKKRMRMSVISRDNIATILNSISIIILAIWLTLLSMQATASTQEEFEAWLELDTTNEHEYINGSYMCLGFADDLIRNASVAGHDLCLVNVQYPDNGGHFIIAIMFRSGTVGFYDPGTDKNVNDYLIDKLPDAPMVVFYDGYRVVNATLAWTTGRYLTGTPTGNWTGHGS